jgi:DNA-binding NtrC family response regulator
MNPRPVLILDLCPGNPFPCRVRDALGGRCHALTPPLVNDLGTPGPQAFGGRIAAAVRHHQPGVLLPCLPAGARTQAERLFQLARAERWDLPILVATQEHRGDELGLLVSLGAADFVTEPIEPPELAARLDRLCPDPTEREAATRNARQMLWRQRLVGTSPLLLAEIQKIPGLARCEASVLILGETGTGKELCARAIHHFSPRAPKPFLPVNCGAIPAELVENELFGHTAGAYTGANTAAAGLVQESDGGSLFLDEIDSLPPSAQVKLLRFLQDKEFRPVGSVKTLRADVRVLAASNSDLATLVRTGRFRADLFYRLNVVSLHLPPLRRRPEDIPELAQHFLTHFAAVHGKGLAGFTPAALEHLVRHDWPGNVRELQNVIERAVIFATDGPVRATDLGLAALEECAEDGSFRARKARAVRQFERSCVQELLAAHAGNISAAARAAGKNRRAFWELIRKYRIEVHPSPDAPPPAPDA